MTPRRFHAALTTVVVVTGTVVVGLVAPVAASVGTGVDSLASVAYQHDAAHDGDSPDPSFVAPFTEAWSATLGSTVGYPVIADGRVFVTVGDHVEALSLSTGNVLWGPRPVGGTYGMVSIAYDNNQVFAINFDGDLTAFDAATGAVDWITQLAGQYAFTSPPTAVDGTVYVGGAGSGGTLYAVDEASGATTWTASVMNGDHSSPAVDSSGVYVSYACEQAFHFALAGTLVWHHQTDCEGGGGRTPVLHDGQVYIREGAMAPAILDDGTGNLVGTFDSWQAPAFDEHHMATVSGGVLTISNTTSGDPLWNTEASDNVTTPQIVNGYVIEGRSDGTVEARDIRDGHLAWAGHAGANLAAPDEHNASTLTGMAEGDGALVVPAGNTLTVFVPAGDTGVSITAGPNPSAVVADTATFSFSSTVPHAQYVCSLDGEAESCSSPVSFTGLDDGTHHFSVEVAYATSGAATRTFEADTVAPIAALQRFRPAVIHTARATAHWNASDTQSGVQAYQLRVRRALLGSPLPSWSLRSKTTAVSSSLRVRRRSRLCVSVRAEDGVGNWSGWLDSQCVVRKTG